jgi:hypothetical protein
MKIYLWRHHQHGVHHKIKPATVLDYSKCKTVVDRSDQMLSYYSFEKKMIKWWKKLFFHVFDLAVVIAHILHTKTSKKIILLKIFYKKITKGLLATAGTEIQIDCQTCNPAGRIIGRETFYIGFQRRVLSWRENLSAHVTCVQRETSVRQGKL